MDTIRAVAHMASEHADRNDPVRVSENARLPEAVRKRLSDRSTAIGDARIAVPAGHAISALHDMGMRPADDRATQIRLAAAIDRTAAMQPPPRDMVTSIMRDYMLQEAAAARMAGTGSLDPLAAVSDPASSRSSLDAASRLKQMSGIQAHLIFDRASLPDMVAIASGRFDAITGGNTAFAVSSQLRLSADAIMTQRPAEASVTGAKGPSTPEKGLQMTREAITR